MNSKKISEQDIKKIAELARIEISDAEAAKLQEEMDSILEYVGKVKEVSGEYTGEVEIGPVKNIWREDDNPTEPGTYSKELIAEFPEREGDYLKVKKIL